MEKQNAIKVVIAVIFFAVAGALLAYNMGLFGGGSKQTSSEEAGIPETEGDGANTQQGDFGGSDQAFRKPSM